MDIRFLIKHPFSIPRILKNKLKHQIDEKALKWALKSPRNASFYYWFFSNSFDREHYSVLSGKVRHLEGDLSSIANNATLRRHLHMIEKGIETIPRRDVWAERYIIDVVKGLRIELENKKDNITHIWAFDVLKKYFSLIKPTQITSKAKLIFDKIVEDYPTLSCEIRHNVGKNKRESVIDYNTFMTLCKQRRSIRWYEDKEVPIDLIKKAITAGLAAPSACNRQPYRYIIVKDPTLLKEVVKLPMGCDTFAHNIKMMVILVGDLSAYFDERDRHLIYIDGGLSAMNFMMSLETLGLSSCPINWPDIEEREQKLNKLFNLKSSERGIITFSIGYPLDKDNVPSSLRKEVEQITKIY